MCTCCSLNGQLSFISTKSASAFLPLPPLRYTLYEVVGEDRVRIKERYANLVVRYRPGLIGHSLWPCRPTPSSAGPSGRCLNSRPAACPRAQWCDGRDPIVKGG